MYSRLQLAFPERSYSDCFGRCGIVLELSGNDMSSLPLEGHATCLMICCPLYFGMLVGPAGEVIV